MKPSIVLNAIVRMAAGFLVFWGFLALGRFLHDRWHLALPAPVIGLALLAAILVGLELRTRTVAINVGLVVTPPARLMISHLGLLFVPAGVGIMTQSDLLRRQWAPIAVALIGSTVVGVAVTGWVMHRLAPTEEKPVR